MKSNQTRTQHHLYEPQRRNDPWPVLYAIIAIIVIFACAAGIARATERGDEGGGTASAVSSSTASAVSSGVGGNAAGGGGGNATIGGARAWGFGSSSAANPSTCYVPILFGLLQWESQTCVDKAKNELLYNLGHRDAAIEYPCGDPDMRVAIEAKSGIKCTIPLRPSMRGPVFQTGTQ